MCTQICGCTKSKGEIIAPKTFIFDVFRADFDINQTQNRPYLVEKIAISKKNIKLSNNNAYRLTVPILKAWEAKKGDRASEALSKKLVS